jgi:CubicO group peptidase (beta-lactamase class C family)
MAKRIICGALLTICALASQVAVATIFPGKSWELRDPAQLGMDPARLDQLATRLGGRGCLIKDGYVVKAWGDQAQVADVLSSAKPVLSTLLFFALQEKLVKSVDQPIADFGWELNSKDRAMTFRHLGAMSSGYARPEAPGEAWAYNDFAIQLYQKTLFDKVFKEDAKVAAENPKRLGALQFEDGLKFSEKRRISASVRDFARIAWFWANRGNWNGQQILARNYFDDYMKPQAPLNLPVSREAKTDDYLQLKSYGGGSEHFTRFGPGIYGFNWWFNGRGNRHQENLTWPEAPTDTFMSIGAGGNNAAIIPSLGLVLVGAGADWNDLRAGDPGSKINQALKLAVAAAGYQPETRAIITGTMKKWQPVTVSFLGPELSETGTPNPFTDFRLTVTFEHGNKKIIVPGFFAADGNAAETSATGGRCWRARLLPDEPGPWNFRASFRQGENIAASDDPQAGKPTAFDGVSGSFTIEPAEKSAPGFFAKGRLDYVGERYLRFAETREPWLKGGADSPENFFACADFDDTTPTLKFTAHIQDWKTGDPTWKETKGKGIIGALNYLAAKKMNSVYIIMMNVKGDGNDVWPWISPTNTTRFDCSKLDQWNLVFDHMDRLGLMLHLLHQEQENDQLLDQGELGLNRRLYYRELIARFAHHPVVVWNLGEENTNTTEQQKAFAKYMHDTDPCDHPVVIHTFPSQVDKVYTNLVGYSYLEGPSFQFGKASRTHKETVKYLAMAAKAGRPWYACQDEIGPASDCVPPDVQDPERAEIIREALWGNLMAGGSGVEWIFAYDTWPRVKAKHLDIACENWRPWDKLWDHTAIALDFFHRHLPFTEMVSDDSLLTSSNGWCFVKPGEVYAVYLFGQSDAKLKLPAGSFSVHWLNPWKGGELSSGQTIAGPQAVALGPPPSNPEKDWVALVRRKP